MVRRLPTFKGYTIDVRLKEFRKAPIDEWPEFIAFESDRGIELISEMEETPEAVKTYHGENPFEVIYQVDKAMRQGISIRRRRQRKAEDSSHEEDMS